LRLEKTFSHLNQFYQWGNSFFVLVYKGVGFVVLTLIVLGMSAYLISALYFILQSNWVVPDVLTPSDPRVIHARTQFLQKKAELQKLESELATLNLSRKHILFALERLTQFQSRFQLVASKERGLKESQLQQFQNLLGGIQRSVQHLDQVQKEYGDASQKETASHFKNRLIDSSEVLQKQIMMQQMEMSDWSYKQRLAEIQIKVQELKGALESSRHVNSPSDLVSLSALQQDHTFLQTQIAISDLQAQLQSLETHFPKQEDLRVQVSQILQAMQQDPLIQASSSGLAESFQVGWVQYVTLNETKEGTPLYGCYLGLVICKKVGHVGKLYAGEQKMEHPVTGSSLRGRYIELTLDQPSWAFKTHLFLRHAPFWL
jgi:hypothetical protein